MRVADVVDAYLTRQRSFGMRFESAGQLLRRFSRAMGDRPIQEVTPEAVEECARRDPRQFGLLRGGVAALFQPVVEPVEAPEGR